MALSDTEIALSILRRIRDAESSSAAEKVNAIKEIGRITGAVDDASAGPGGMSRAELQAELERVRALLAAEMPEPAQSKAPKV